MCHLSIPLADVESGYAGAIEELQSEYVVTMESLYNAAAQQMERKLQHLQLQLQTNSSAAAATDATPAPQPSVPSRRSSNGAPDLEAATAVPDGPVETADPLA